MLIMYNVVLLLLFPLLLFLLIKEGMKKQRNLKRWGEYFGFTSGLSTSVPPIWIHAVSVGECIAATPLITELKKKHPEQPIVVTTTTTTGAEQIAKLGGLVEHRYMPIDFGFAIKGFLKAIRPTKMLIIETELWPNTLHIVHKAGAPITVVNARLSEKSRQNYSKVQALFNLLHPNLTKVLCQSEADANRFESIGVDREKLEVTGSIKFDIQISDAIKQKGQELRKWLGKERLIWIAASTHKGEDEQVLEAHKQILAQHPYALLILVPRHPERFDSVYNLSLTQGFNTVRRQSDSAVTTDTQVYLGDSMGEMLILLGAADICFMGGSLIGDKVGGHNMLEPAALGMPVITGPSYFNFKQITEELLTEQAILVCEGATQLSRHLNLLMNDHHLRRSMQSAALSVVKRNQGSLSRTIKCIQG